jgi:YVTN family beta-propeller protein
MRHFLAVLILLAAAIGSHAFQHSETPKDALLVLAKADGVLAIVDPTSLQVIARVPVGHDPHEVVASSDGKTAYASNYGGGAYNTLAVVDLVAQAPLPPVDLGPLRGPHGLTFVGGKVWFTAEAAKAIGSYDPVSKRVDWILGTGQNRTHMIWVSPDMQRIITTNVSSGTVSIIEKTSGAGPGGGGPPPPPPAGMQNANPPRPGPPPRGPDWNQDVIRVGNGSEGFDVSPDGKEIWAANAQDGTISIIDVSKRQVVQTVAADVHGANRLKFTLDGKLALISTLGGPDVTVIEAATRKTIKRIPVGRGAAGILMDPGRSRAFVACSPDGYVAVIDLHSLAVTAKIQIGKDPDGLAWASRR